MPTKYPLSLFWSILSTHSNASKKGADPNQNKTLGSWSETPILKIRPEGWGFKIRSTRKNENFYKLKQSKNPHFIFEIQFVYSNIYKEMGERRFRVPGKWNREVKNTWYEDGSVVNGIPPTNIMISKITKDCNQMILRRVLWIDTELQRKEYCPIDLGKTTLWSISFQFNHCTIFIL